MFANIATIDGPPASGKTTMARLLSHEFNLIHLDSGAIFRAITLQYMKDDVNLDSTHDILVALPNIHIKLSPDAIFVNEQDVSQEIRSPEVTANVRFISFLPQIRNYVSDILLFYSKIGKVVCDGRNAGTQVFPNAQVKFYLTADLNERVLRRYKDFLRSNPISTCYADVYKSLKEREEYEVEKKILLVPENAIVIDNTHLSIEETLETMKTYMV